MLFITSDQELSLSRSNTLQDAIIIIVGCHNGNPLCGCDQMGNGTDRIDPTIRLLLRKTEFLSQNTVELGQDERGDEKLGFPSADAIKDLIRLAPREGQGGDHDIGVKDDPHGMEGLCADRVHDSIDILLRSDSERLCLEGGLSLKFPPALVLKVQAQGFPE
jgi:hypothetical protein